ncbi:MAG: hypothetical protein EPN72_05480 [Nevskiaceae bacterium]|nr:MAG: hypothetical protein EPN63_03715 [Nevskiaceae bacterium]TBR73587.1 MAG: hypothetical protein EPN72_05480 [Nevskiaceae bacterium]
MTLAFALIIIAMTIATGILMSVHVLRHRIMAWPMAAAHGSLAVIGVALLAGTQAPNPILGQLALIAFIFLLVVILSGAWLWRFRRRRELPPLEAIFIHAVIGIVAFGLAFAGAF